MHIDQKNLSFIVLLLVCDDDSHAVVSFGSEPPRFASHPLFCTDMHG